MGSHTSPRGRSRLRALATMAGAVAVSVVAMLSFAASASATSQLTASQTTGLTSGQTITVNGTGFTPSSHMYVILCDLSKPGLNNCDQNNYVKADVKADGTFSTPLKVTSQFASTDCTKTACGIQTSNADNPNISADEATLKVTFGSGAALPGGVGAGQADTSYQLVVATVGGVLALLLLGAGALLIRRSTERQSA